MTWTQIVAALIAAAPGIITAISSFRNGGKLKRTQQSIDDLNGKVVTIPAPLRTRSSSHAE